MKKTIFDRCFSGFSVLRSSLLRLPCRFRLRIGDVTTTMLWVQQKISTAGDPGSDVADGEKLGH